jgi:hypothetical protein
MRHEKHVSWVVYLMPIKGSPEGLRAICEQSEWETMERNRPGHYTLIQGGLTNEGEAEKLARGTSGDKPPRTFKAKMLIRPGEVIHVGGGGSQGLATG